MQVEGIYLALQVCLLANYILLFATTRSTVPVEPRHFLEIIFRPHYGLFQAGAEIGQEFEAELGADFCIVYFKHLDVAWSPIPIIDLRLGDTQDLCYQEGQLADGNLNA